jgi:hypothetical protein
LPEPPLPLDPEFEPLPPPEELLPDEVLGAVTTGAGVLGAGRLGAGVLGTYAWELPVEEPVPDPPAPELDPADELTDGTEATAVDEV